MHTVRPLVVVFLSHPTEGEAGRFVAPSLELRTNVQDVSLPISFPVHR